MKLFFEKKLPGTAQGYKFGIKIKKKIFSLKSKYQKIEVFDTHTFGRILVLDGIIQLSQKYEFIYHEMMAHLPLFCHSNPKKVLIIGGGDGGVLREVLKHPIKKVYLADIDKRVFDISKKFFPFLKLRESLNDKRVNLFFADGSKFVKEFKNFFDITIIDLTDPIGPARSLFAKKFYKSVFSTLNSSGVMITQSGNWLDQIKEIKDIQKNLKAIFPFTKIHRAFVPDYQGSEFTFSLGSKRRLDYNLSEISKRFKERLSKKSLKYYSPQIHFTSGVLPEFLKKKIV